MRLTPNVLYVEDDADTRELVAMLLGLENYQVVLAGNYDEALLLARLMRFDLYIMDNWLPGRSGVELCKKLREIDATTPIIFLTAKGERQDRIAGFKSGVDVYLTKPFDPDELLAVVSGFHYIFFVAKLMKEEEKRNADKAVMMAEEMERKRIAADLIFLVVNILLDKPMLLQCQKDPQC